MERKTINIKLDDGKEYIFSERNDEDNNYFALQRKTRRAKLRQIQEDVIDKDNQLAMLMREQERSAYSQNDLMEYLFSDVDEMYQMAYDSFKIENSNVTLDEFKKLCSEKKLRDIMKLINELEVKYEVSDAEICEIINIKLDKLNNWKEEQPNLYKFLKYGLKKKLKKE